MSLVKGVPFYGFHVGYNIFIKIYLLNPIYMTRLADLLRQGAIMKKIIQPFESHLQYLLQWMCDYNLYGCAYIDCNEVKFRSPVPDYLEMNSTVHRWHNRSIPPLLISDEITVPRQSHCSIEVDVCVQNIINRFDVRPRPLHHDFIERKHPIATDEKLVQSMAGLWRDETRRRKARMGEEDPGISPFPPEVLVSVSADPRNTQAGGWIHEAEYENKINEMMKDESQISENEKIGFEVVVDNAALEDRAKIVSDSIEDLFPENLLRSAALPRSSRNPSDSKAPPTLPDPEVDESRLMSIEENEFPHESDEEIARAMDMTQKRDSDYVDLDSKQFRRMSTENHAQSQTNDHEDNELKPEDWLFKKTKQSFKNALALESLGIRNASEYLYMEEDAFEIPLEYAGESSTVSAVATAGSPEPCPKRRRISDAGNLTSDVVDETSIRMIQNAKESRHNSIASTPPTDPSPVGLEGLVHLSRRGDLESIQPQTQIAPLSHGNSSRITGSEKARHPFLFDQSVDPQGICSMTTTISSSQLCHRSMQIRRAFNLKPECSLRLILPVALSSSDLGMQAQGPTELAVLYQNAYYSNDRDVPDRVREYAGKEFKIESGTVSYLPAFDPSARLCSVQVERPRVVVDKTAEQTMYQAKRRACGLRTWEIGESPPTGREVQRWVKESLANLDHLRGFKAFQGDASAAADHLSQIGGATPKNAHGFKYSQKQSTTSVKHETQYMSIMSLEIHVSTRGSLVPNPDEDEIGCVFWCLQSEDEDLEINGVAGSTHVGLLALSKEGGLAHKIAQLTPVEVEEETSELDLITRMVDIVRYYDPDILTGYEVHGSSWGYIIERARCKYDYNLCDEFSRMKSHSHGRFGKEDDRWGFNHTSTIRVTGRHMINIWRAMRGELNLLQYTLENVVFQLCHRRVPHYSFQDLTSWYESGKPKDLAKVIDYYISRVQLDLEILDQNELIPRTSEQARLLGVDFFSVFSRGSQFKVESLMFRIAKPENLLLPSPSRKQVGQQNALECLPLVMEPQSAFYNSPLLVLDFQSLYPSVMIAYNYCYSTFLGRVVNWRGQNKMGFTDYHRRPRLLELLKDQINIAPNGIMYAKPEIRKSLLAKMLGEILETRVMIKSGMKIDKEDKALQRLLHNRQLALKLIANVTYGYTSASFSGRMPCSEIADSIVQTGRETLERAIALIHSVERWGAEVVYGDTDSLFVYLKGRTKDEAFDIGQEIAKTITDMNPRPVKLKFEKVYFPCVLLAKKRYVGFKYESKSQRVPEFDAKGIETVRRDGTPAEQKIEEKALKILFRTADLSQVKAYFQKQCMKIMRGKVSIQDFCFAKEVKLGTYSDKGLPPPGALISTRRMLEDPRAEPQYGERVPYVVITGAPGARLIDRCVAPDILLQDDSTELDAEYYISKNLVPPLERIFNLVGANVRQWYDEMPKYQRIRRIESGSLAAGKDTALSRKTLESYMKSSTCLICSEKLDEEVAICARCMQHRDTSLLTLHSRLNQAETKAANLAKVCRSCAGLSWDDDILCDSKDCPVFYSRSRHLASLRSSNRLAAPMIEMLSELKVEGLGW